MQQHVVFAVELKTEDKLELLRVLSQEELGESGEATERGVAAGLEKAGMGKKIRLGEPSQLQRNIACKTCKHFEVFQ